jgi:hypothetical protein
MATVENKRLKKKEVDTVANRQPRFRCAERPKRVRGPGLALPEPGKAALCAGMTSILHP